MYSLYKGKVNQITFTVAPSQFMPGSTFVFLGKRRRTDPDSKAILKASTNLGLLYDPLTGKGTINLTPATNAQTGEVICELQMISPQGIYVLEPSLTVAIAQPININTLG
jgi:hypothetical protein